MLTNHGWAIKCWHILGNAVALLQWPACASTASRRSQRFLLRQHFQAHLPLVRYNSRSHRNIQSSLRDTSRVKFLLMVQNWIKLMYIDNVSTYVGIMWTPDVWCVRMFSLTVYMLENVQCCKLRRFDLEKTLMRMVCTATTLTTGARRWCSLWRAHPRGLCPFSCGFGGLLRGTYNNKGV